jgi:hypothetical protein
MSFRAPAREKWRPTIDLAGQTLREAAAFRERKAWRTSVLQSSAARREHGEMALRAPEKAPIRDIFRFVLVDFPVFFRELALPGALGREWDLELALAMVDRQVCGSELGPVSDLTSSSSMASRAARRNAEACPKSAIDCNRLPWTAE